MLADVWIGVCCVLLGVLNGVQAYLLDRQRRTNRDLAAEAARWRKRAEVDFAAIVAACRSRGIEFVGLPWLDDLEKKKNPTR